MAFMFGFIRPRSLKKIHNTMFWRSTGTLIVATFLFIFLMFVWTEILRHSMQTLNAKSKNKETVYSVDSQVKFLSPDHEMAEWCKTITKSLTKKLVKNTNAVYQFIFTNEEHGDWHLDLKNGKASCAWGVPRVVPDTKLTIQSNDFSDMIAGKLKPENAIKNGKMNVTGNTDKTRHLMKIMRLVNKHFRIKNSQH